MKRSIIIDFYLRDLVQILIGASILAVPVAFTEEVWGLGSKLPAENIFGIFVLSVLFISAFVYYNYHHEHRSKPMRVAEFTKRVASTYFFSFLIVSAILTLIEAAPWGIDWMLSVKRAVIVTFPASMSAAVADVIE